MDTKEKRGSLGNRLAKGIKYIRFLPRIKTFIFIKKMDVRGKWSQEFGETNARSGGAWNGI
jgi:hypothetical protein